MSEIMSVGGDHFSRCFLVELPFCFFSAIGLTRTGDGQDCPDGPNCVGPRGTIFSYPRLYDFVPW